MNGVHLCDGCQQRITDQFYLFVAEKRWHIQCLRCSVCGLLLETNLTCFIKNGKIFCKEDYFRIFAKRCSRCRRVLMPKDLVMKAKEHAYHVYCFTCTVCQTQLQPGVYFGLTQAGLVYCSLHCDKSFLTESYPSLKRKEALPLCSVLDNSTGRNKERLRHRRSTHHHQQSADNGKVTSINYAKLGDEKKAEDSTESDGRSSTVPIRPKRMRTSFKQQQLRAMRAYFQLNHNPDSKDLKHLAQKTGLTKRILQVWFQNARAKYRRNAMNMDGGSMVKRKHTSTSSASTGLSLDYTYDDISKSCSSRVEADIEL